MTTTNKPKRATTPFDEAKAAQRKLDAIDQRRLEIRDALSPEALALLDALEEHRASQPIAEVPSSPEPTK